MRLYEALGIGRGEMVAFIGAGGKTSALLRAGQELSAIGWRILATTTVPIAPETLAAFPFVTCLSETNPRELSTFLSEHNFIFVYDRLEAGQVVGLAPDVISALADSVDSDVLLIKADDAARKPLKAPLPDEPILPPDVSLVVPVVGFDSLGQPFDEAHVYNAAKIADFYGFPLGEPTQPAWIAQAVREETLGLQGIPAKARIVALLNKVEKGHRIRARRTARMILHEKRVSAVAIGRVQRQKRPVWEVRRRIGAIVLAGGLSSRMGQSKPLLPWGHRTIIETIVRRLTPLRFDDLVVVTGYQAASVRTKLKDLAARPIYNPDYGNGEMLDSLKVGLRALDESLSACLIFLGDQPQLNPRLIHQIMLAHAEGRGTLVAPSYMKRRGHPILIDRRYWREILDLSAGKTLRDVMNAYPDEWAYVTTEDDEVLRDMDTPADYRAALRRAGLL